MPLDCFAILLNDLQQQLNFVQLEKENIVEQAETAIGIASIALNKLKTFILKNKPKTDEEEIRIFKSIMPIILSQLTFFTKIRQFELQNPYGGIEEQKKYINFKLYRLKVFFEENSDMMVYYRAKETFRDNIYFIRGKYNEKCCKDALYYQLDSRYFTLHSYLIAQIIANDKLQNYYQKALNQLDLPSPVLQKSEDGQKSDIFWTGSKVEFLEIMSALHEVKAFNNGKVKFATVLNFFGKILNVEVSQASRTIAELSTRNNSTKFLDSLVSAFKNRLERVGEKNMSI